MEDVSFAGRTATLQRDGGLADLAIALVAAPETKARLEAFVDTTGNPAADAKLSAAMAQAAGESPLLPNFTIRGRAANRRVEAVGVR